MKHGLLYRTFFRLGWTGFGGPVATMAMMREECKSNQWMTTEEFDRNFTLCKVLPGPAAFKLSAVIGHHVAGYPGSLFASFLFTFPAVFIIFLGAAAMKQWGTQQWLGAFLAGMRPAVLGVILASIYILFKGHWAKPKTWIYLIAGGLLSWRAPSLEPLWIISAGLTGILWGKFQSKKHLNSLWFVAGISSYFASLNSWASTPSIETGRSVLAQVALSCLNAGALIFGSGLAIVPLLEHDFVTRYGFLTHSEFVDGLSLGFVTPGPVVASATYFGYFAAGTPGAALATFMIFFPSLIYVYLFLPFSTRFLKGSWMGDFFSATIPVIAAAILLSTRQLAVEAGSSAWGVGLAVIAVGVSIKPHVPPWILLPVCGAVGVWLL